MRVTVQDARLSFPDLHEAVQFQGSGAFNYRATFLLDPDSKSTVEIDAAIEVVAKAKWGAKAPAILKSIEGSSGKFCFVSGDSKDYDGYEGKMALSASRPVDKGRPTIIDRDKSPLVAADGKPYGGCFVNAIVEFWAQDNSYGKGIRCTLLGVQFLRDGDSFSAGAPPSGADEFESLGDAPVDSLV